MKAPVFQNNTGFSRFELKYATIVSNYDKYKYMTIISNHLTCQMNILIIYVCSY